MINNFRIVIIALLVVLNLLNVLPLPFLFVVAGMYLIDQIFNTKGRYNKHWYAVSWRKLLEVTILTIVFQFLSIYVVTPITEALSAQKINLEQFESYTGSIINIFVLIVAVWVIGGVLEELVYRKYILQICLHSYKLKPYAKVITVIVTSLVFAAAHEYQGVPGIVNSFISSLLFSYAFLRNGKIIYAIWAHGIYDTLGIIFIILRTI